MPELPDVVVYIEVLEKRLVGETLEKIRFASPFVLRSFDPPAESVDGKRVVALRRLGKRIVIELEDALFIVIHLMVAGRFRWGEPATKIPGKLGLAAFDFSSGSLILTEAGSKKRASIHIVRGEETLAEHDRGGAEPLEIDLEEFSARLLEGNHTLKRALTDPRKFSGIGNAYSDEIFHAARVSPIKLTSRLTPEEVRTLFEATRKVLSEWTERLREEADGDLPKKVTAFRPEMAVHGRFGKPCPVCGKRVQRIVYAENETNYCASCQTGGRLLKDRALSRLLREDWPRSIDEL